MQRLSNNRLQSRLLRVFLLQLILISIMTVVGVLATSFIVERLLVNKALQGEADFFWSRREQVADFQLPETLNLEAFLSSDTSRPVPEMYQQLTLGQHRVNHDGTRQIVHVSESGGERLYLLFAGGTVSSLAFYFGVLPLILVLLTMYGFAFIAYLLSKRAVSPISSLANRIETFDLDSLDANDLNLSALDDAASSETVILVDALEHFVARSNASIERERDFTRFASHELRTPLAVIQGSVSSLELLSLEGAPARAVQRIKRTSKQMSDMLNTLLFIARDEKVEHNEDIEPINVNRLVDSLLVSLKNVYSENNNHAELIQNDTLFVGAPESVLSIVLGNVIGNAFSYTHGGDIEVVIDNSVIKVIDTGVGMDKQALKKAFLPFYRATTGERRSRSPSLHQGLGLAIVKQTCKNYGWKIELHSEENIGTTVVLDFCGSAVR